MYLARPQREMSALSFASTLVFIFSKQCFHICFVQLPQYTIFLSKGNKFKGIWTTEC